MKLLLLLSIIIIIIIIIVIAVVDIDINIIINIRNEITVETRSLQLSIMNRIVYFFPLLNVKQVPIYRSMIM